MRNIISMVLVVVLFTACNQQSSRLKAALEFAEDNRKELEKVLTHYRNEPEKLNDGILHILR